MPTVWTTYLAIDDAATVAANISEAGGAIVAPPFDVMDAERMAVAQDPAGGEFGIWQATSTSARGSRTSRTRCPGMSW